MADYLVETFTTQGEFVDVVAAIAVELETVENTKTIFKIDIIIQGGLYYGYIIYQT